MDLFLYYLRVWSLLNFLHFLTSEASLIDVFVSKKIQDYETCPHAKGPTINITHSKPFEEIKMCWRFLTTAYPHCSGKTCNIFDTWSADGGLNFQVYQPISGRSEDEKHAGWFGFYPASIGQSYRDPWQSILFNQQLKPYEWQSVCFSYSKQTKKLIFFHNGLRYLN